MAQYEKVKVRSKSGLLVTKWKDKKTGRLYTTKPTDSPRGRVGVGDTKKLKKIQGKNQQKLKPYLGLRNTNIGVGSDLKKQIRDTKVPNEKDPTKREEIDVTSKAYKAAVKSGSTDATAGGSREEIDVTSSRFKEAVTNPEKVLKKAARDQQKTDVNQNASKLKIKKGPEGKIGKIMGNKSLDSAAKLKELNKLKKSSAMFQRGGMAHKLRLAQLRLGR